MSGTDPRPEPQTEAGRRLLAWFTDNVWRDEYGGDFGGALPAILRIEAQARAPLLARVDALEAELVAANRVCALFGWTAAPTTERGMATHELWTEWKAIHGEYDREDFPELDNEGIAALARRREATYAAARSAVLAAVAPTGEAE